MKKKTGWLYILCAVFTGVCIVFQQVFKYLYTNFSYPILGGISVIFDGIYLFIDSLWFIGTVFLLFWLVKVARSDQDEQRKQKTGCIFIMLIMLSGIYSLDRIQKHTEDIAAASKWLRGILASIDPVIVAFLFFVIVVLLVILYLITKLHSDWMKKQTQYDHGIRNDSNIEKDSTAQGKVNESASADSNNSSAEQTGEADTNKRKAFQGTENGNLCTDRERREQKQGDTRDTLLLGGVFVLLLPIVFVLIYSFMQSEGFSSYAFLSFWGQGAFVHNAALKNMEEAMEPFAMVCAVVILSAFGAWVFHLLYRYSKKVSGKLGHPQALLALLLEIVLLLASPALSKIQIFKELFNKVTDGEAVNTVVVLLVIYLLVWFFLIMTSEAGKSDGGSKLNGIEGEIHQRASKMFENLIKIAADLIDASIRLLRFATADFLEALFNLLGIKSKEE